MMGSIIFAANPYVVHFPSEFQPVSIKMAKEQNLSLNPTKISVSAEGLCAA